MASVVHNIFMQELVKEGVHLTTDVVKIRLCMTDTQANTEAGRDADTVAAITALSPTGSASNGMDIFNGTIATVSYVAGSDPTLASKTLDSDTDTDSDNILSWGANNVTFSVVAGGSRAIDGVLIYQSADDIPICYVEFATPIVTDSSDLTIKWNSGSSSGTILKLQQG